MQTISNAKEKRDKTIIELILVSLFCNKEDCYYPTWDKQTTLGSRDGEVVIELASHQCGLGLIRKNHLHVSGA